MRGVVVALIAALVFVLSGCGDESPSSAGSSGRAVSPPPATPPPVPPPAPAPPPPPFTASLDAASLGVSQGSRSGVWVTLTRASGFTDDVSIALDATPAGVDAQAITVGGKVSAGLFTVATTSDLASGSTVSLTLVATGGGTTVRLPLSVNVTDPVPTSESLIAADLAAGKIDYGTSLLYRAYALFHDARLPSQYAGTSNPRNDGFFREASNSNLPADVQSQLAPFLARPTETNSVLHTAATANRLSNAAVAGHVHALAADVSSCVLLDGQVERNGWKSALMSKDGATSVRFWVPCTGESTADNDELTLAVLQAATVVDAETTLMGQPIPDKGGDFFGTDDAIDVYLVDGCEQVPRNDSGSLCSSKERSPSVVGVTINTFSAATAGAKQSSAFVIIDSNELASGAFKSTFAHEFFHVLEDAYNYTILSFVDSTGVFGAEWWFTEAAATWAESHFVSKTAATEVYPRFVNNFQHSHDSLHTSHPASPEHLYSAFIWPFFYEQKAGDNGASMQAAWNAVRNTEDFVAADHDLDGVYGFAKNFRIFAVRNLNFSLPGVLDDDKRYKKLDGQFPDGKKPDITETELSEAGKTNIALNLEPLRGDYYRFHVTGDKVKKVIFHFDKITVRDGLDIDGVIKIKGKDWTNPDYTDKGEVKFCLDKPEQALEDSYLVFSNHNVPLDKDVSGLVQVEVSDVPCGGQWTGTAKGEYGLTVDASVTWLRDDARSTDVLQYFYPTGSATFTPAQPDCTVTPGSQDIGPMEGTLLIDYSTDPATYKVQGGTVWVGTYHCGNGTLTAGAGGIWLGNAANPPAATGEVTKDSDGNGTITGTNSAFSTTFTWSFTEQ